MGRNGKTFEWSSCSINGLKWYGDEKTCLLDVPQDEDHYSHPKCGNKIVEEDEECDCGTSDDCDRFELVSKKTLQTFENINFLTKKFTMQTV